MINRLPTDPSPNWFFSPLLYFALNLQTGILSHGTVGPEYPEFYGSFIVLGCFMGNTVLIAWMVRRGKLGKPRSCLGWGQISNILIRIA